MNHLAPLVVEKVIQLRDSRREVDAWKLLATEALGLLAKQHSELERVRSRYHQLLDERRKYTANTGSEGVLKARA